MFIVSSVKSKGFTKFKAERKQFVYQKHRFKNSWIKYNYKNRNRMFYIIYRVVLLEGNKEK